jgi:hypothetical protein
MLPRYCGPSTGGRRLLLALGLGWAGLQTVSAFVISAAPGLFVPSFRDGADADSGRTTVFGWGLTGGRFDGVTDDDNIDAPPVNFSPGGLNGTLIQLPANTEGDGGANDILAGSNNIYASPGGAVLNLDVPINGPVGAGFTTIIVQGRTAFGAYPEVVDSMFGIVGGVAPAFVEGLNAAGQGQFWAKYELPGNAGSYTIPMSLPAGSSISIAELKIDTLFSDNGFAADWAVVPEPSGVLLVLAGAIGLTGRRRRGGAEPCA